MNGNWLEAAGFWIGDQIETDEQQKQLVIRKGRRKSRKTGSCSAGFAIHPKPIDKDYKGKKDLAKLKTYQYEFNFSLTPFEDKNPDKVRQFAKWAFSQTRPIEKSRFQLMR